MGRAGVGEGRRGPSRRALSSAGHTMGLSRSMMSVIERRNFMDRLLVFGGMIVVVCIVLVLLWWRK